MSSSDPLVAQLAAVVGDANVLTTPADMAPFVEDWRGAYRGTARLVVRPGSTNEVAGVVRACAAADAPMVPQGGNTGMCGGAIPDASGLGVVIALGRMNRIVEVNTRSDTLTAEAGCVLEAVQEAASACGRLFPLSLAAEGSCQIGGNLATNAGGINVLRYGNTRDLVLGIEAVLPDGRVWNGLRALRKDNRGYDLKQLFIGAEGTLGIITNAVLKLFPRPSARVTGLLGLSTVDAAIALLGRLREACGESLSAYELIGRPCLELVHRHVPSTRDPLPGTHPWYVLLDLSVMRDDDGARGVLEGVLARALERGEVADAVVAETLAQSAELWRLREGIPEATRAEGPALRSDIAVAVNDIPAFIERAAAAMDARVPGARIICFGHVGDGNLHFNVLPPANRLPSDWPEVLAQPLYDVVDAFAGSFSAEHGVGQAKRAELARYKDPVELELMRAVKRALDPRNLMNPGKIFE